MGRGSHLQPEPAAVGPNCHWQRAAAGPWLGTSTPGSESAGGPAPGDLGIPVPALGRCLLRPQRWPRCKGPLLGHPGDSTAGRAAAPTHPQGTGRSLKESWVGAGNDSGFVKQGNPFLCLIFEPPSLQQPRCTVLAALRGKDG